LLPIALKTLNNNNTNTTDMNERSKEYDSPQLEYIGTVENITGADKMGSGDGSEQDPLGG
jgi:hypothetical protein